MISPKLGKLKFDKRFTLDPKSKEKDFDSKVGNAWDDKDGNHWRIIEFEERTWKGNEFALSAIFKNGIIDMVEMMQISGRLGEGWDDFNSESELKRKKVHDAILDDALGEKRDFKWGHVNSNNDPKVGCATLQVIYSKRPEPKPEPVVENPHMQIRSSLL